MSVGTQLWMIFSHLDCVYVHACVRVCMCVGLFISCLSVLSIYCVISVMFYVMLPD